MEGLVILLLLILIITPIVVISMLSGIRGKVDQIQIEQSLLRQQVSKFGREQAKNRETKKREKPKVADLYEGKRTAPPAAKPPSRVVAEETALTENDSEDRKKADQSADAGIPLPVAPKAALSPESPELAPVAQAGPPKEDRVAESASRQPSKLEETLSEVFAKIWNWFLVGEEHRSKKMTAEYAIASVWLLRVGIVAVVTGIGFFLKLSIERGWIGEEMRTAMSALAGVGMLVAGLRMHGKKYDILAQGFLGGGIAVLYFSAYAASVMYGLVPDWGGFLAMGLVTITAGVIAVRADSMTAAILGIVGGYLSPFFFGEGAVTLPVLYAYLLILSCGVLGVAYVRKWRLLQYMAFVLTYAAFFFSLKDYRQELHFGVTITFLSLFFVVHSAVVYVLNLSKGITSSVPDILHFIANAGIYSATAYYLIDEAAGRPFPAIMSLGLALYCIAHVAIFIRRRVVDPKLMVTLLGLASAFTVWTLPIVFEGSTLTISFSLLALLLVGLGQIMASNVVGNIGFGVFWFVAVRLTSLEIPSGFNVPNETLASYWLAFSERIWTFAIGIGSMAVACLLYKHPVRNAGALTPAEGNDLPPLTRPDIISATFFWGALALGFTVVQLEFHAFFEHFAAFQHPVLTTLWCGLAGFLLLKARRQEGDLRDIFAALMFVVVGIAAVKLLFHDLSPWLTFGFKFRGGYTGVDVAARLLDFGVVIATLCLVWRLTPRGENSVVQRALVGAAALAILFIYLNLELRTFLDAALPAFVSGGMSILWAVFAMAMVVPGIVKGVRGLRYAGLSLFGLTIFKVFLSDLRDLDIVFRVIAAIVVGIVLLLGSFAYIHSSARFRHPKASGAGAD